jgi:hypothetical protein
MKQTPSINAKAAQVVPSGRLVSWPSNADNRWGIDDQVNLADKHLIQCIHNGLLNKYDQNKCKNVENLYSE